MLCESNFIIYENRSDGVKGDGGWESVKTQAKSESADLLKLIH